MNFIQQNIKIIHSLDNSELKSLEYYHDLTSGQKNPKLTFIANKQIKLKKLKKLIKKYTIDSEYAAALGRHIQNAELWADDEEEQILLYNTNNKITSVGDNDIMEIASITNVLYKQGNLKLFGDYCQANKFNLMVLIWEWVNLIYKMMSNVK